jgi:hypothetical protein
MTRSLFPKTSCPSSQFAFLTMHACLKVMVCNFPAQIIMEWVLHTKFTCLWFTSKQFRIQPRLKHLFLWLSLCALHQHFRYQKNSLTRHYTTHTIYKQQEHVSASALAWAFYTLLIVHCAWLCKLFWTTWTICATVSQKKEARIMEVW